MSRTNWSKKITLGTKDKEILLEYCNFLVNFFAGMSNDQKISSDTKREIFSANSKSTDKLASSDKLFDKYVKIVSYLDESFDALGKI